jgi:hypothetical protein
VLVQRVLELQSETLRLLNNLQKTIFIHLFAMNYKLPGLFFEKILRNNNKNSLLYFYLIARIELQHNTAQWECRAARKYNQRL